VRPNPRVVLRGLLKFIAVVVAAGVVGAGLGIGLAELSGDDDPGTSIAPQATTAGPGTPGPTRTTPATTPAGPRNRTTRVQIRSAVLYPASPASAQAQQRARVVVRVRVTSRSTTTIAAQVPVLLVGAEIVRNNRRAAGAAGRLLRPLRPMTSATGELHFAATGAVTRTLTTQRRARLRIAGRTVGVSIRISRRTPAPQG
jgi:hypothetical protein